MNICYFCNEVNLKSGWAVLNFYTIKESIKKGNNVTVITATNAQNIEISGVVYHRLLFPVGNTKQILNIFNIFQILNIVKSKKISHVHFLVEHYLIYAFLLGQTKLYFSAVGTYSVSLFRNSKIKFLYQLALKKIAVSFPISDYTKKMFVNATGFNRISVSPLGVDFSHFSKQALNDEKNLNFCLIGEIKERKGVLIAIKAVDILKFKYPSLTLFIAGNDSGAYAEMCKDYIRQQSLDSQIFFLGRISDQELLKLYAQSICNVLPSVNASEGGFEGFGLIHLEANAMGLPSIGSLDTGNESAISEGVNGFLAKQNDPYDLAKKMELVIQMHLTDQYDRFSEGCVKYAQDSSWEKYFSRLQIAYSNSD